MSYLKSIDDNQDGDILVYQAGSGTLRLNNSQNLEDTKGNQSRGGSLYTIKTHGNLINYIEAGYQPKGSKAGMLIEMSADNQFRNITTKGDSGSGFYIYDTKKTKVGNSGCAF